MFQGCRVELLLLRLGVRLQSCDGVFVIVTITVAGNVVTVAGGMCNSDRAKRSA